MIQAAKSAPFPHSATHKAIFCYYTRVLTLHVPSLNQHLMQILSYTKSGYLTNTPTRFVLPELGAEERRNASEH
jgi:hypothetical protein